MKTISVMLMVLFGLAAFTGCWDAPPATINWSGTDGEPIEEMPEELIEYRREFYEEHTPNSPAERFDAEHGGVTVTPYGVIMPWTAIDLADNKVFFVTSDGSFWSVEVKGTDYSAPTKLDKRPKMSGSNSSSGLNNFPDPPTT